MKTEPKEYTLTDIIEARDAERERVRIILEYLLNKNSNSILAGGINYAGLLDDIQDFEHSLQ